MPSYVLDHACLYTRPGNAIGQGAARPRCRQSEKGGSGKSENLKGGSGKSENLKGGSGKSEKLKGGSGKKRKIEGRQRQKAKT